MPGRKREGKTVGSVARHPEDHATMTLEEQYRWRCSNCKQVGPWTTGRKYAIALQFEEHVAEHHPDLE